TTWRSRSRSRSSATPRAARAASPASARVPAPERSGTRRERALSAGPPLAGASAELLERRLHLRELGQPDAPHDGAGFAQALPRSLVIAALDEVVSEQRERAGRLLLVADLAEGVDAREEALFGAAREPTVVVEERLRAELAD